MTIYELVFAVLISAGFTVPSSGMGDEMDNLSPVSPVVTQKYNSEAAQKLILELGCPYVNKKEQKKFLQLNKDLRNYFQNTTFYLKISERIPSDQLQGLLEGFICLNKLDLSEYKLTDDGMQYISKLKNLKHLNLSWCNLITNHGMQHILNLTDLILKKSVSKYVLFEKVPT